MGGDEGQDPSYMVGDNIYWYNYFAKQLDIPMFSWTCGHPQPSKAIMEHTWKYF